MKSDVKRHASPHFRVSIRVDSEGNRLYTCLYQVEGGSRWNADRLVRVQGTDKEISDN